MKLTTFDLFSELMETHAGLSLSHAQSFIVEARLRSVMRAFEYGSIDAMARAVEFVPNPDLVDAITDALLDRDTAFFEDLSLLRHLKEGSLPNLFTARTRKKQLRVWAHGVGRGAEAYTLALILHEAFHDKTGWDYDFVATDLSHTALQIAQLASYPQALIQRGVSAQALLAHWDDDAQGNWTLDASIADTVTLLQHNPLNHDKQVGLGTFDIIFCRDMLHRLSPRAQHDSLAYFSKALAPDGFLYLGPDTPLPQTAHIFFTPVLNCPGIFRP